MMRQMHAGLRDIETALMRSAFDSAMRIIECSEFRAACISGDALPDGSLIPVGVFPGTKDQVRAVRGFVRARLAGHPVLDNAVLVASELVTNSIVHSASGRDGGKLMVHVAEIDAVHVGVWVTDEGGTVVPSTRDMDAEAESGRGLEVIESLTALFRIHEQADLRSFVAVVLADPPRNASQAFKTNEKGFSIPV